MATVDFGATEYILFWQHCDHFSMLQMSGPVGGKSEKRLPAPGVRQRPLRSRDVSGRRGGITIYPSLKETEKRECSRFRNNRRIKRQYRI